MRDDFAIIIPSYNRLDILKKNTLKMLDDYNYTGKWYVVVDDGDPQLEKYKEEIPEDKLKIFHKPDYYDYYDTCYNGKIYNSKLYALAFIQGKLVNDLDLNYYIIIDDDIPHFTIRKAYKNKLISKKLKDYQFEGFINIFIEFLKNTPYSILNTELNIKLFGGLDSKIFEIGYKYALNGMYFIKKEKIPYKFYNVFDEECCSIQLNALRQKYEITVPLLFHDTISFKDNNTRNDGGNSSLFNKFGNSINWIRAFSMLMTCPNNVESISHVNKIHIVSANKNMLNFYPMIIDERWKK